MAKRLSRTADIIQRQSPNGMPITVVPRGMAVPLDTFLRGRARFVRRLGSVFPLLSPRNTMILVQPADRSDSSIVVDNLVPEIPIGSIISFRGRELEFVSDVIEDTSTIRIERKKGLLASHGIRTPVYLHAVPIRVDSFAAGGSTTLILESDFLIVLKDRFVELTDPDRVISGVEHTVESLTVIDEDSLPFRYVVELDTPLVRDHDQGDLIYLRGFPAYKSGLIPLPTQNVDITENIGPFLWDLMDSRLHDGIEDPDVFLAIGTISSAFLELEPIEITKINAPHYNTPIPASAFSFWDIHIGSMEIEGNNTVALHDEDGRFLLAKDVVPNIPPSITWRAGFEPDEATEIRIGFHLAERLSNPTVPPGSVHDPNTRVIYTDFDVPAGVSTINITTPPHPTDRIEIGIFSPTTPNRVKMREWAFDDGRSSWVQYTVVSHVNGDYTWASSGIIIKPIFLNKDDLRRTNRLDSGLVML